MISNTVKVGTPRARKRVSFPTAAALAVFLTWFIDPPLVQAFDVHPVDATCPATRTIDFSGAGWTGTGYDLEADWASSLDEFNLEFDDDSQVVDVSIVATGTFDATLVDSGTFPFTASGAGGIGTTTRGIGLCSALTLGGGTINPGVILNRTELENMDMTDANDNRDWEVVFQHEVGHTLGLRHTGQEDSYDLNGSEMPLMSTCMDTEDSSDRVFEQDLYGNLQQIHSDISGPETMGANLSWDRGTKFWGRVNGTLTESGEKGRWRPNSSNFASSYFFQTTATATDGDEDYDVQTDFRRTATGQAGQVYISIYATPVSYANPATSATCGGFQTHHGRDQNSERTEGQNGTLWFHKTTDTWQLAGNDTSWKTFVSSGANMTNDYVDIRIRIGHNLKSSGGSLQTVEFDETRLRRK